MGPVATRKPAPALLLAACLGLSAALPRPVQKDADVPGLLQRIRATLIARLTSEYVLPVPR